MRTRGRHTESTEAARVAPTAKRRGHLRQTPFLDGLSLKVAWMLPAALLERRKKHSQKTVGRIFESHTVPVESHTKTQTTETTLSATGHHRARRKPTNAQRTNGRGAIAHSDAHNGHFPGSTQRDSLSSQSESARHPFTKSEPSSAACGPRIQCRKFPDMDAQPHQTARGAKNENSRPDDWAAHLAPAHHRGSVRVPVPPPPAHPGIL